MQLKQSSWSAILILLFVGFSSAGRCADSQDLTFEREGFAATYFAAEEPKPVGVIVLGGSEGGKNERLARGLSAEGYAVLALAYFKAPGTPDYLDEIALEYFDKPLGWFANQSSAKHRKIVLVGTSKGAELALLLASRRKDIDGVIAISPSSVVFQSLPKTFWPPRSSWSSKGEPVPFVAYDASKGVDPNNLLALYQLSLSHADQVAKATIPVEKIDGAVLLLSGKSDRMWPAADMADAIAARLAQHKFAHPFENIQYDNAGHTLTEYFMIGGTQEGNKNARIDSWQKILTFLANVTDENKTSPLSK